MCAGGSEEGQEILWLSVGPRLPFGVGCLESLWVSLAALRLFFVCLGFHGNVSYWIAIAVAGAGMSGFLGQGKVCVYVCVCMGENKVGRRLRLPSPQYLSHYSLLPCPYPHPLYWSLLVYCAYWWMLLRFHNPQRVPSSPISHCSLPAAQIWSCLLGLFFKDMLHRCLTDTHYHK